VGFGASAVVALVVVASVACDTTSTGPAGRKSVSINDDFFDPATTSVLKGDTVYFVWAGVHQHDVIFDVATGVPANCGLASGGVCTRVFTTIGTFTYNCTVHPGMNGSVTVQ